MNTNKPESAAQWTRNHVLAMCESNKTDGNDGVFIALENEKRAVRDLEKKGLVRVVRTAEKCAGLAVWRVFSAA